MFEIDKILGNIDSNFSQSIERLKKLLSYKSISTDPEYKSDCKACAQWLVDDLNSIGFDAKLYETPGHPMVVGHYRCKADPKAKTILFYGHYDVQPVDPIELWHQDPFQAVVKDVNGSQAIVARGSSDDKGQLMTFIEACRAYQSIYGDLPLNITILFEGEEESGSPSLVPFLEQHKELLKADFALVCDTSMWDPHTPSISIALRGMLAQEIVIKGADMDLHSGMYGGAAANPINILAQILSDIKGRDGHINIEGFYDGVEDVPADILNMWDNLHCNSDNFLKPVGLSEIFGEKNRTLLETIWSRPTADVNGIIGGYCGEGFKTVIASVAKAKISFRLVQGQDPVKLKEAFDRFVAQRVPKDCKLEIIDHGGSPAIAISQNEPFIKIAMQALGDEWGKQAVLTACGGSIPVVGEFQNILAMQSLLVGFALDDDNIHSPNEKYNVQSFHKGQRSWARIIAAIAENK